MKLARSPRPAGARHGRRLPIALAAATAALGSFVLPAVAQADQVVVVDSAPEYRGPSWGVLSSGLFVFAGTYTASFVVAATSNHPGDKALFAPLVGPWLDIANRCPTTCNGELGNKVLLGFDGVFQGLGVLSVVSAFLVPRRHRAVASRGGETASFHVVPASMGRGTPGLMAVGTF
jgi:hypothetical protein